MSDDPGACESFQSELANRLGEDEVYGDPHLKTCKACRQLLIELETIAEESKNIPKRDSKG